MTLFQRLFRALPYIFVGLVLLAVTIVPAHARGGFSGGGGFSSRSSFSYSAPSRSFSAPAGRSSWITSRPAAPTVTSHYVSPPRPVISTQPQPLSVASVPSAYRPAPAYHVTTTRISATSGGVTTRTTLIQRPALVPATSVHFSGFESRPVYASVYHYHGAYYNPGYSYQYQNQGFPWFEFWMWNTYFNHPYGQQYPTGYGPPMGSNGQWAASGQAVYDWHRDPCSPLRFFLVRWLFCHR